MLSKEAWNPYRIGSICIVDLLLLTTSEQFFFTKQPVLMRGSTILSLPLQ